MISKLIPVIHCKTHAQILSWLALSSLICQFTRRAHITLGLRYLADCLFHKATVPWHKTI
jgi:hypothetical protein